MQTGSAGPRNRRGNDTDPAADTAVLSRIANTIVQSRRVIRRIRAFVCCEQRRVGVLRDVMQRTLCFLALMGFCTGSVADAGTETASAAPDSPATALVASDPAAPQFFAPAAITPASPTPDSVSPHDTPNLGAPDYGRPTIDSPSAYVPAVPLALIGSAPSNEAFDRHFRQVLDAASVPGGAYAIVKNGRIVQASGHGVRALGKAESVTAQTVFRTASVSKTFAAELTALLVQEGKLHWDDQVSNYVPQFKLNSPTQMQGLQIQHLLGQSTGIISNAYDNLLDANVPLPKILPRFRELKPICKPGQCYTYQNILFSLIEPAIEHATRQPYEALVQQRLFQPLQMRDASVGQQAFLASSNRALPHIKRQGQWMTTEVQPGYYEVPPAAGINASAEDLAKWLLAQLGHFPNVIPPAVVDELTRKRVRTLRDLRRRGWREHLTDAHYGLGWRIYRFGGEDLVLHSGWVKGYVAEIAYSKQRDTGLVVLLNAETSAINDITTTFWSDVIRNESYHRPVQAE